MSDQKQEAIFIGNGKEVPQYEGLFNLNICLSDIPKEFITTSEKNGKKYIRLNMSRMREVREWGTHSIKVDTWKPTAQTAPKAVAPAAPVSTEDNLPF